MANSLLMRGYLDPTSLREYEVYMKLMDTAFRDDPFTIQLNRKMDKEFAKLDSKYTDTTEKLIRDYKACVDTTLKQILSAYSNDSSLSRYQDCLERNNDAATARLKAINNNREMYISQLIREQWHYARDMAVPINKEYKKFYALLVFCRYVVYEHRRDVHDQIIALTESRKNILSYGDSNIFKKVERYNLNYSLDKLAMYVDKFIAATNDMSKVKEKIEECFRHLI